MKGLVRCPLLVGGLCLRLNPALIIYKFHFNSFISATKGWVVSPRVNHIKTSVHATSTNVFRFISFIKQTCHGVHYRRTWNHPRNRKYVTYYTGLYTHISAVPAMRPITYTMCELICPASSPYGLNMYLASSWALWMRKWWRSPLNTYSASIVGSISFYIHRPHTINSSDRARNFGLEGVKSIYLIFYPSISFHLSPAYFPFLSSPPVYFLTLSLRCDDMKFEFCFFLNFII